MVNELKFGIIGESPGNGHPYSWSAIFNGYNEDEMRKCPYPIIYEYLKLQKFPEDFLNSGKVTHIWTQNKENSKFISKCSKIPNLVDNVSDLVGKVDAILLARDDANNHYENSKIFIEKGIPIYIDKPLGTKLNDAKKILENIKDDTKIFTCSALSYSPKLKKQFRNIFLKEKITNVKAIIKGEWETYAIHLIEPILKHLVNWENNFSLVHKSKIKSKTELIFISDDETKLNIICDKDFTSNPTFEIKTLKNNHQIIFDENFLSFKCALQEFINIVNKVKAPISRNFLLKTISLVEKGI